jgi:hypothetical protein
MRNVFLGLAFIVSSLHATAATKFSFGSHYDFSIPDNLMSGATIIQTEELILKTSDSRLITGYTLSSETAGFSEEFSILDYPSYLLSIKPISELNKLDKDRITKEKESTSYFYNIENHQKLVGHKLNVFILNKKDSLQAYVVNMDAEDYIFIIKFDGFELKEAVDLIREVFHVE